MFYPNIPHDVSWCIYELNIPHKGEDTSDLKKSYCSFHLFLYSSYKVLFMSICSYGICQTIKTFHTNQKAYACDMGDDNKKTSKHQNWIKPTCSNSNLSPLSLAKTTGYPFCFVQESISSFTDSPDSSERTAHKSSVLAFFQAYLLT
jgi:hypothetical protein